MRTVLPNCANMKMLLSSEASISPLPSASKLWKMLSSPSASAREKPSREVKHVMKWTNASKSRVPSAKAQPQSSMASALMWFSTSSNTVKPVSWISDWSSAMSMVPLPSLSYFLNCSSHVARVQSRTRRAHSTTSCSVSGCAWTSSSAEAALAALPRRMGSRSCPQTFWATFRHCGPKWASSTCTSRLQGSSGTPSTPKAPTALSGASASVAKAFRSSLSSVFVNPAVWCHCSSKSMNSWKLMVPLPS
mmetsp:Transcript_79322/g.224839  ORF Transcript_79322/g.224839 Transcript_79322/m.224839 type:complete len:248 (+) Transcript_79322:255-998(+)